jgi:hypothetical protein
LLQKETDFTTEKSNNYITGGEMKNVFIKTKDHIILKEYATATLNVAAECVVMVFSILPSCLPVIYNSIPVKMLP